MIQIDKTLLDDLFSKAKESDRLRMNYDLRTSASDNSQRMLNALLPGSIVPIHRHPSSNENVLILCGKMVEIIYEASPQPSPEGKGVHTADPMLYGLLKDFAAENRKNPTEAESILWNVLRANGIGFKFRQQHIIEDFIVDFFCNEINLTIELDGEYHNKPEQMKSDEERTARLKELGCTEIRFTNEEVIGNIDGVISTITDFCNKLKASPFRGRLVEAERIHLDPSVGNFGCVVPAGAWHTVEVLEPSVLYEAKDGKYGEDGSETLYEHILRKKSRTENSQNSHKASPPESCIGDLKSQITYLIGMERQSVSMDVISPLYVSRMLNVPLEDVEKCMKEMGI